MEKQIVEYNVTEAAIAEMEKAYMGLTIKDFDDTEGFQAVHDARMVVKGKRVEVEKRRKELKADALAWGKLVDSEAKKIFGKLEPIETHLQTEENKVIEEKKRIKEEEARKEKEKIQSRIDTLAGYGKIVPFFDAAAWTDEEWGDVVAKAKDEWDAEQSRIAEEKRLEEERKAKEEADRKAEAERLAKEREELERQKAEQEAAQAKIDEENRKIREAQEAAQKKIDEEKAAIEKEKAVREAAAIARDLAIKEEREAQERKAKEEKERAEREAAEKARQDALRPDKEKLLGFAEYLGNIEPPTVKSEEANEVLAICLKGLDIEIRAFKKAAEGL